MYYSWAREAEDQVRTSPESVADGLTVVGSDDDMAVGGPPLSTDIFVSARPPRRDLLPASLRRSRTRGKHARRAQARANHPCHGPRMYLLDDLDLDDLDHLEGGSEKTRIDLRRRFEDDAGHSSTGSEDSAAG